MSELDDVTGYYSYVVSDRTDDAVYTITFCPPGEGECGCGGWTVYEFLDDYDEGRIEYSTCVGADVCPDCRSNRHPGCCGEFS